MWQSLAKRIFGPGLLLAAAAGAAQAFPAGSSLGQLPIASALVPAAMCGYTCRTGGRYIPGPPSVCAENGLSFCGPSRRPDGPSFGYGGGGYERRGWGEGGGGGCRTITIERDDGTIRTIRRCD
jgi:hypothetical protein